MADGSKKEDIISRESEKQLSDLLEKEGVSQNMSERLKVRMQQEVITVLAQSQGRISRSKTQIRRLSIRIRGMSRSDQVISGTLVAVVAIAPWGLLLSPVAWKYIKSAAKKGKEQRLLERSGKQLEA